MKKLLLTLFAFALLTMGGFAVLNRHSTPAYAGDCGNNSIVPCGVGGRVDLIQALKTDKYKDLHEIYQHYGVTDAMIANGTIKTGTVYKNGDVKIGSELVATNAISVGRQYLSPSKSITLNKKAGGTITVYQRDTSVSFEQNSLPAMIFVDNNGKFQAAVVLDCGNPVIATPKPKPIYACEKLLVDTLANNQYAFGVQAKLNDVTFKQTNYTVKDNSGKTVYSYLSPTMGSTHMPYAPAPGSYTVEATVTVVNAGKTETTPVGNCKASFTVPTPPATPTYACTKLNVSGTNGAYTFTPTVSATGGATFTSITYTVKDASGKVVATSPAQTSTNAYSYLQTTPGTYSVTSALVFTVSGKQVNLTDNGCSGSFTVPTPPVEVKHEYVCNSLTAAQSGDRTNFVFTPNITLTNATLKNIVYTVKNASGQSQSITATDQSPVKYTQSNEGDYSVSAIVNVTVDGKDAVATGDCAANFTVSPPPATPKFECTKLTASPLATAKNTYQYSLYYVAEGGAQLTKASVDFGDTAKQDLDLTKLVGFQHAYTKAGTYTTTATLSFKTSDTATDVQTVTCSTQVTIAPEMCKVPGKENLPVDSPQCYTPCKYNPNLPSNSPNCVPCEYNKDLPKDSPDCKKPVTPTPPSTPTPTPPTPTQLVNTGPGDLVGVFAALTVAGAIAHRVVWTRFRFGKQN